MGEADHRVRGLNRPYPHEQPCVVVADGEERTPRASSRNLTFIPRTSQ
jgi:hypothetical protein